MAISDVLIESCGGLGRLSHRYFESADTIEFKEANEGGAGFVRFTGASNGLRFGGSSSFPAISWTKLQKCADGAFVRFLEAGIEAHVVELKSNLTRGEWSKARRQFEGMLLRIMAVLGVAAPGRAITPIFYIAYARDFVSPETTTAPIALKQFVGGGAIVPDEDDWNAGEVDCLDYLGARLVKLQRDAAGNAEVAL